jgi:hypothetical protein
LRSNKKIALQDAASQSATSVANSELALFRYFNWRPVAELGVAQLIFHLGLAQLFLLLARFVSASDRLMKATYCIPK